MAIEDELSSKFLWTQDRFNKRLAKFEAQLAEQYLGAYLDIRDRLNNLYESMNFSPNLNKAMQYNRLNNLNRQIADYIKKIETPSQVNDFLGSDAFAQTYYEVGYALESSLQLNLRFGLLNEDTIKAATVNPYDLIKWKDRLLNVDRDLVDNITRSIITGGLIRGDSYQTMTRILKNKIGGQVSNNIMRIVRTEGQRAHNWGNLTAMNQAEQYADEAGVKMIRVWSSAFDMRTREMHKDMDGRHEDNTPERGFTLPDGIWTQAPCLSGVAHHDINCRCSVVVQVDGITGEFRRDGISKKAIPYQNYHQYFNNRILKRKAPIRKPAELKRLNKPINPKKKKPRPRAKPKTQAEKQKKFKLKKQSTTVTPKEISTKTQLRRSQLREAQYKTEKNLGGGINESKVLKNDISGVYKPKSGEEASSSLRRGYKKGMQYKREVMASVVDEELGMGLVPPTEFYNGSKGIGSIQDFKTGYKTYAELPLSVQKQIIDDIPSEIAERWYMLDRVLCSSDRHAKNYMIKLNRQNKFEDVALIDNGLCSLPIEDFYRIPRYINDRFYGKEISPELYQRLENFVINEGKIRERLNFMDKKSLDLLFERATKLLGEGKYYEVKIIDW